MRRNHNAVGDCKCDHFYHVKVCTEHDEDCAVSLQISLSSISATSWENEGSSVAYYQRDCQWKWSTKQSWI